MTPARSASKGGPCWRCGLVWGIAESYCPRVDDCERL
jgi:hypothetical protein